MQHVLINDIDLQQAGTATLKNFCVLADQQWGCGVRSYGRGGHEDLGRPGYGQRQHMPHGAAGLGGPSLSGHGAYGQMGHEESQLQMIQARYPALHSSVADLSHLLCLDPRSTACVADALLGSS